MEKTMVGKGLYDAAELAVLCGLTPDRVVSWSTASARGPAPILPSFDRMFSFDELVAFTVAKQVHANGITDQHLRRGVARLRELVGVDNPLAREDVIERLATSGDSFLLRLGDDEFEDVGLGGQGTFREVVRIYLRGIEFDTAGSPLRWLPFEGVSINPEIQAGAPCIEGTRIPTAVVWERKRTESSESIGFDLDLSLAAIEVAVRFEDLLAEGHGLPV